VLPVDRFDIHHSIDMQQLWAEVRTLWEAGEPYHLDELERNELNEHNEEFVASDPVEERMEFSLDWDSDPSTWEELTVTQILIRCGSPQPTRHEAISASRAIRTLNGDRSRRSNGRKLFAVPKLRVSPPWGP
jgi:putative DNA primase/helicase